MQEIRTVDRLPKESDANIIYYLPPLRASDDPDGKLMRAEYDERTDRNGGCLKKDEEQQILYDSSVGIMGLGGMGGPQAITLTQLGIGWLYLADLGTYDTSNRNRQPAARKDTVGTEKAIAAGEHLRLVADDVHLYLCLRGLNEETADFLIKDRDAVIDMIEFWSLADRIWLHRTCKKYRVVAINCNSIVHASFGTRFDYTVDPTEDELGGFQTLIERYLDMTYERARYLQTRHEHGTITGEEKRELMEAVYRVFIPQEIEYMKDPSYYSTCAEFRRRLFEEDKAPVISVNPPFAAGWCATEVYFEIIEKRSPIKRDVVRIATFPTMTKIDIGKKAIENIALIPISHLPKNSAS